VPSQPAPLDPYTPEAGPGPGEERALSVMRWAWVLLAIVALLILIALLRRRRRSQPGSPEEPLPPTDTSRYRASTRQ
jgi:hypothetical protein